MYAAFVVMAIVGQGQFEQLDYRVRAAEQKIANLEKVADRLEAKFNNLESRVSQLYQLQAPATANSGTQQAFVQSCENGVCQLVPVAGASYQQYGNCTVDQYGNVSCDGSDQKQGFFRGFGRAIFGKRK